jgi:predicted signal transduction protein with EAL and GGDEF domain
VSEGIETIEQALELDRLECDELQGYLFSRPLPPEELTRWLSGFSMERYGLKCQTLERPQNPEWVSGVKKR